jgi:hypothetical protein
MEITTLQNLQRMQLHHARVLLIITELFQKNCINEDQKLALKFGVLNDDSSLMDFYFENICFPQS